MWSSSIESITRVATAPGEATNRPHPPVLPRHSRVHTKQGWNVIIKIHIENASNVAYSTSPPPSVGLPTTDLWKVSLPISYNYRYSWKC
ncbi:hypothetical protein Ddc_01079 [Ditylenchus destructor]|nr:hypothetical protein Ddc_01079 [Ditylenchus destructor]